MKKRKINLQLFATAPKDLKTESTTTYGAVKSIDEAHAYFDRTLKQAVYDEYTFEKYADTIILPQNNGETYTFRKSTPYVLNFNELVEGVVPTEDDPMGIEEFTVKLADFGGFTTFTNKYDIYALNGQNSVATRIEQNQGGALGEALQKRVRDVMYSSPNLWAAGATQSSAQSAATLAAFQALAGPFSLNDLRLIKVALKRQKVKPYKDGKYYFLMSPEIEASLFDLTKTAEGNTYTYLEVLQNSKQNIPDLPGYIGDFMDFRFVTEDALGEFTNDDGTVAKGKNNAPLHGCVILGKYGTEKGLKLIKLSGYGAPQTIVKKVTDGGAKENPLNQIGSVGWVIYGWAATVLYTEAVMVYLAESEVGSQVVEVEDTDRQAITAKNTGKATINQTTYEPTGTTTKSFTSKTLKQSKAGTNMTDDTDHNNKVDE